MFELKLGAAVREDGMVSFRVWAPRCQKVEVKIQDSRVPMAPDEHGYFSADVQVVHPGQRYVYVLDETKERPDPVSRFQPEGVHGPSEVVDPAAFKWTDQKWKGLRLEPFVIYELHPGTFTPEGDFEAAARKIPYLKELGVTCVEIMPVAQFPGKRNWGYDGVGLYAVQNSYGGPEGLKKFVNACHRAGLAVCLDVVYNHFGPEGNYLHDFGPYFSGRYHTPWGDAVNYDDSYCD
ncbi:alpha-amylase family glycosyl hydrolase, partial [Omnitrophica bacterium]|nr:alpha-amylase family glycosyl hydrolase [Candidatus Omnitrophota bacterium]